MRPGSRVALGIHLLVLVDLAVDLGAEVLENGTTLVAVEEGTVWKFADGVDVALGLYWVLGIDRRFAEGGVEQHVSVWTARYPIGVVAIGRWEIIVRVGILAF